MEVTAIQCTPNRLFPDSDNLHSFRIKSLSPPLHYRNSKLKFSRQRRLRISASSSSSPGGFSWVRLSQSIRSGSQRFFDKLGESMKEETGIDLDSVKARVDSVKARVSELTAQTQDSFQRRRDELEELVPQFIHWNKWEHWKDVKNWDPKRVGVLVLYALVLVFSSMAIRAPFIERSKRKLTEAYMEALIPEPTPTNVRKFKKGMWRKTTPKGLKLKKFIEGPDGTLVRDTSFVGEGAWEDDTEHEENLNAEDKNNPKEELGLSVENQETGRTWRERLLAWKEILQKDKLNEQLGSLNAKYAVEFDMKEVENSLRKELAEKVTDTHGTRALWISKRWWYYRPRLPYTYFLQKLDSSEVAAVVFTEDLKRLYVTMKEGFPLEYTVDIPLDPLLFEAIAGAGVEVDLLQKRQMHYFLKAIFALLPGLLLLWLIRQSILLLFIVTRHTRNSIYTQLFDYAHTENFVVSVNTVGGTKSMYNDVVVGGDVWDVVDELMMYMREPMRYHGKDVALVRGVLIGGPPGTGKTLLARTLAKKSGLPFVFASGAEFMDGEKSGRSKLSKLFYTARRNAPAFVFVDEIDAIAGRHAKKDPRRKDTLNALLQHLDGEKGTTGFDRFSFNEAVIFMCATNRPDELDEEFMRLGRIDRHVYIGLPNAKQRIRIFGIHSAGKDLAEDVDFEKLVFRTVRYSGADIRNLINEAAIMSVRKGHSKIYQEDIVDVLDKQLLEGMGVLLTEEEQQKCEERVPLEKKRLLAVHEAGHVVLAHLFPRFDLHAFSQLLPGGKETAMSVFYPREEMHVSEGYMLMQMVVAHGGHCAERIVFGDDITDGSTDDLEKLTKIAREMVISPLNYRLGLTQVTRKISSRTRQRRDDDDEGDRIKFKWDDPNIIQAGMTPEVSELFTRELTRYIEETEELAMKGLMDNRDMLDLIAKELLENMRITGSEVEEIIKGLSPIMLEDLAKPTTEASIREDAQLGYKRLDIYPAPLHR